MTSSWWQTSNRFTLGEGSDDENEELYSSHSESEDETTADKQQKDKKTSTSAPVHTKAPTKYKIELESDEESEKRTIKTAKEKQLEEMQKIVKSINNHIKINDWNAIYTGQF
jgi:translation initiation factor 3 subunit C